MIGTRATIDLDALTHNYNSMRQIIAQNVKITGVVKANAYGHDLITIGKHLESLGVDYLGVANVREGKALRKSGIKCPILVMGYTFEKDYDIAVKHDITLTLFSMDEARKLNLNASYDDKKAKIHLKFDTGFNRLGYKDPSELIEAVEACLTYEFLIVEGIFTHLALDSIESDEAQFAKFDALIKQLRERHISIPLKHACDSIATIAYPDKHYDMVRLGAILYGYCSRKTPFTLRPVMSLKTNVTQVKTLEIGEAVSYDRLFIAERKTKIAVLPIGYADGLPRHLSGKGKVMVNGHLAPIVGLMCMDQCMIDVTDVEEVSLGTEVILFDDVSPQLLELAKLAETNRNELLSRIAMRVPREVIENGKEPLIIDYLDEMENKYGITSF